MMSHTHTQSGVALIIFLTILILGITAILLSELNTRHDLMLEDQAQTRRALIQAKEALIGFAATYADTHPGQPQGYLPCPDHDGDGSADPSCSRKGYSVVGRFPWKTLGLPPLRDGSNECLWYAVSSTYKDSPKQILTSDTDGLFTVVTDVNGNPTVAPPKDRVIAIIFSPGKMLEGQNRAIRKGETPTICGSTGIKAPVDPINHIENYLDHYDYHGVSINNATGNHTFAFVSSSSGKSGFFAVDNDPPASASLPIFINAPLTFATYTDEGKEKVDTGKIIFNDTLMLITHQDFEPVYRIMDFWVAKRVRDCLDKYADMNAKRYPWPSKLNPHDYDDDNETYFGRIPQPPLSETMTTSSSMAEIWPVDPNIPSDLNLENEAEREKYRCFNEDAGLDDWQWGWWKEWKKMVFFAVHSWHTPKWSEDFKLQFTIESQSKKSESKTIPAKMIVLVAGRKLNGQTRIDETQIDHYLEEENNDEDEEFKNAPITSIFNDVTY